MTELRFRRGWLAPTELISVEPVGKTDGFRDTLWESQSQGGHSRSVFLR